MSFIDLSHVFEDGMPGFVMRGPDGRAAPFTARVRPFLTHKESEGFYEGKASFEITEVSFHTSMGTYLDAPFHRHPDRRDIAGLTLEEVILPGVVLDATAAGALQPVGPADVELPAGIDGRAVLVRFDWDRHWGTPEYERHPFIDRDLIDLLIERGARLVGVDAFNIDDRRDPERPAHTRFLGRDVLVVENLRNLSALPAAGFRFFAVPIKARGAASMTIRAFAETVPE